MATKRVPLSERSVTFHNLSPTKTSNVPQEEVARTPERPGIRRSLFNQSFSQLPEISDNMVSGLNSPQLTKIAIDRRRVESQSTTCLPQPCGSLGTCPEKDYREVSNSFDIQDKENFYIRPKDSQQMKEKNATSARPRGISFQVDFSRFFGKEKQETQSKLTKLKLPQKSKAQVKGGSLSVDSPFMDRVPEGRKNIEQSSFLENGKKMSLLDICMEKTREQRNNKSNKDRKLKPKDRKFSTLLRKPQLNSNYVSLFFDELSIPLPSFNLSFDSKEDLSVFHSPSSQSEVLSSRDTTETLDDLSSSSLTPSSSLRGPKSILPQEIIFEIGLSTSFDEIISKPPKSGSLFKLLQWLTTVNIDTSLTEKFLYSYRHFGITPYILLETLHKIYLSVDDQRIPIDKSDKESELRHWNRERILRFINASTYNLTCEELFEIVYEETFISDYIKLIIASVLYYKEDDPNHLQQLLNIRRRYDFTGKNKKLPISIVINENQEIISVENSESMILRSSVASPTSDRLLKLSRVAHVESNPRLLQFSKQSTKKVASHMHMIEFSLFEKVQLNEFDDCSWTKDNKKEKSPNIISMTTRFNMVAYWIATQIVTAPGTRQQMEMLKRFIIIAAECRSRNNFTSIMQILAGINMCSVSRLKEAWLLLPQKCAETAQELEALMSSKGNYKLYRTELAKAIKNLKPDQPPIIPYLGVYLRDVLFIHEANPDYDPNGLLNLDKMKLLGTTFSEITKLQSQSNSPLLNEPEDPLLFNYLTNVTSMDDEALYQCSTASTTRKSLQF